MSPVVQYIPDFTFKFLDHARYQILNLLGAGSYGAVYRARERLPESGKFVPRAIKVISKHGRRLGALEIGLHSLVSDHANVITMEEAFEDEDNYFLVLDLCPGGDLFSQIWEQDAYRHNDERVRTAFVQLVDAVEACHATNVYHRDLKPENILCNEDGSEVYLCDFGLGRGRPISREFGSGSLNYMSPGVYLCFQMLRTSQLTCLSECLGEDLGCRPYSNVRHDIWALGVVLFNMITAEHPWGKASTEDDQFSDFLHNPEFFLDHFDISEGANTILRSIFTLNPMGRTTLPELRAAILALGSFF
ncbi:kinase-like protein, partial [Trametes versicolor FP-101664 SS1]|uniref:kinase-like protein n=1 Tax=Trametes versicolor (strain FP-101664) TaxID=717944 RepID=UPI000462439F